MQIFVKTIKQKHITLEVEPTTTIEEVRLMVQDKTGNLKRYKLICCGRELLNDTDTLADYSIGKDMTIHEALYLRG